MIYQILINNSQTSYRIKYQKETFWSKLKRWWTPYPPQEPEYIEKFLKDHYYNSIYEFSSLKSAEEAIDLLIRSKEDENPRNWHLVAIKIFKE